MMVKPKEGPHICFASKSIHCVLLNNTRTRVGGAEIQQKILADALVTKGWKVSFVTERVGDKAIIPLDRNMTMFPVLGFTNRNKYLGKLLYLPFQLWTTLRQIDADIYYQRNPDYLSGVIALFCKINGKHFVLAGASNWNFDKGKEGNLTNILDKFSARCGIRLAGTIIVQNNIQKDLLRRNFKREANLFYNIFPTREQRKKGRHILWVGRIKPYKNPKLFLELVRRMPEHNFVMVGGKSPDTSLAIEIEQEASELENLSYLGHQSFEMVEKLFDETSVFVSTSIPGIEGFPNTLLQAWSRGIPVISSFDLDGLISRNNLGIVVNCAAEMVRAAELLLSEHRDSAEHSRRIQNFFEREFSASHRIHNFIQILMR